MNVQARDYHNQIRHTLNANRPNPLTRDAFPHGSRGPPGPRLRAKVIVRVAAAGRAAHRFAVIAAPLLAGGILLLWQCSKNVPRHLERFAPGRLPVRRGEHLQGGCTRDVPDPAPTAD
jgi:hypothetical protein